MTFMTQMLSKKIFKEEKSKHCKFYRLATSLLAGQLSANASNPNFLIETR